MKRLIKTLSMASVMVGLTAMAEPLSLSINFAGGRKNAAPFGDVTGTTYHGAWSIPGDKWNNVRNYNNTALGDLVWSDGEVRSGVTLTTSTGNNWTTGKTQGIFYSYLDSGTGKPEVTIAGLTAENGLPSAPCTVYVYVTTDSNSMKLYATKVNDVQYTGVNFTTTAGTDLWGISNGGWSGLLEEGTSYLRIGNVMPDANGEIRIVGDQNLSVTPQYRGGFAAIQLVFYPPDVTATCDEYEGTVAMDGGEGSDRVSKSADFGATVTGTLTATPAAGRAFVGWTGDIEAITSGSASDATVTVSATDIKKLRAVFGPAADRRDVVLSVNFAGGQSNDILTNAVTGTDAHGHFPVAGDQWNNVPEHLGSGRTGLVWNHGAEIKGVSMSHGSKWNYCLLGYPGTAGTPFYSYLDDYAFDSGTGSFAGPFVEFAGLTTDNGFPATCTVCVYMSTDNLGFLFTPPTVNGTTYTFVDGRTTSGTSFWGSTSRSQAGVETEGGSYLVIRQVPVIDGKVRITTYGNAAAYARGGIAAVQLAFDVAKAVTVTATSADAAMGKVQADDGAAGASATAMADGAVTTTLRALPEPGFNFLRWSGKTDLITTGTINDAEITVGANMSVALTAEFVADNVPATATWIGGGDRANASDPANWDCRTASGTALPGVLPTADTIIAVAGDTTFNLPAGQSFLSRTFSIGNCRLTADCDWRGLGANLAIDGTVDLNGHKLYVSSLSGSGTITDRNGESAEQVSLSVNFNGTRGSKADTVEARGTVSGSATYGAEPVAGSSWNNIPAKNSVDRGGLIWSDGTAADGVTFSSSNNGVIYTTGTTASEGSIFYSYLDDAACTAKIAGLTAANGILSGRCTVYVYMSTDAASRKFKAVTVNGTSYEYANGTTRTGTGDWGSSDQSRNGATVYGGNYLQIENVVISPSGEIVITPSATTDARVARGGIAAIQIAGLRRTSASTFGELHLDVAEGATLENSTVTLDGMLKVFKEGAGTYVASKELQTYVGGTEITSGGISLGKSYDPLGQGTGLRSVIVREGAILDYNGKMSTTQNRYSFVLDGGTVRLVGTAQASGWNVGTAALGAMTLTADSHLTGKFFFLGHNTEATPLTFNGHTLNLDLDGYVYTRGLVTQDAGTIAVNSGWLEINGSTLNTANLLFKGDTYLHTTTSANVQDFAYERNYWGKHAAATWVNVAGRYEVGANRPAFTLLSGATLDFNDWPVGTTWDSTGVASVAESGNNHNYSEPGLVTFTANGEFVVEVGDKVFPRESTKLINWAAVPEGATFTLDPVAKKRNVLEVKEDGLYILNVGGLVVIIR